MITVALGLRNDFSRGPRLYWGKIIGTVAGLVTLKPWFVLLGLALGIISDLMYTWIDPRIDFDSSEL